MAEVYDVVVIGAGIAGLSTAIWARRLGLSALVLEQAPQEGGQLRAIHQAIVDYPGLPNVEGPSFASALRAQAERLGAVLRLDEAVIAVDAAALCCTTVRGQVKAGALVLATGLAPRRLGVPGEETLYERGLVRRPSRQPEWFAGKRVAVVGGGDRAVENVLLLAPVAEQVYLIHRRDHLRAREQLIGRLWTLKNVQVLLSCAVKGFAFDPTRVDVGTAIIPVDAVCPYIGNRPNTALVTGQVALTIDEYLVVDSSGRASVPGVYAVGDVCTQPHLQSLSTAAGQAMAVAKQIALSRKSSG